MKVMSKQFKLVGLGPNKKYIERLNYKRKLLSDLLKIEVKTSWDIEDIKRLRKLVREPLLSYQLVHKNTGCSKIFNLSGSNKLKEEIPKAAKALREIISKKRKEVREPILIDTKFFGATIKKDQCGVYQKPGQILELLNSSPRYDIKQMKKPWSDKIRFIGIELEFNYREDGTNNNTQMDNLREALKSEKLGLYCNLTTDPSCGLELRTLLPEHKFDKILAKILRIIKTQGFKVNQRCGTHVHLDMRDRDVETCYNNLYMIQDIMYKLIPIDRRSNTFCKKNTNKKFKDAMDNTSDRYRYINTQAYKKQKTLEVRLHHGSLKFNELKGWVRILLKAINNETKLKKKVSTTEEMIKSLEFKKHEIKSLEIRYNKFNSAI